jgi:hypothetical protein
MSHSRSHALPSTQPGNTSALNLQSVQYQQQTEPLQHHILLLNRQQHTGYLLLSGCQYEEIRQASGPHVSHCSAIPSSITYFVPLLANFSPPAGAPAELVNAQAGGHAASSRGTCAPSGGTYEPSRGTYTPSRGPHVLKQRDIRSQGWSRLPHTRAL